jgi:hypothetical protein
LLFLGFLFVGLILILAMGIVERERERAALEESPAEKDWIGGPGFLTPLGSPALVKAVQSQDGSALARIERYLEVEHRLAAEFVSAPSVRKLYRCPPRDGSCEDPSVDRIEQHLRREQAMVSRFVAQPSIERFHEQFQPQLMTA